MQETRAEDPRGSKQKKHARNTQFINTQFINGIARQAADPERGGAPRGARVG
jgi:hypothetical protein